MSDILSKLCPPLGSRHSEKRLGRGIGSGLGKTCGRGQKGQKARQPGNINKLHFQGGQTPMQRRLPKRGFRNPFPNLFDEVNVVDLERFAAKATIDPVALHGARLISRRDAQVKILGDGEITKAFTVHAHGFTQTAREKIERAGGQAVVISANSSEPA